MQFSVFKLFSCNQSWADTDINNLEIVDMDVIESTVDLSEPRESGQSRKWTVPKVTGPSKVLGL